MGIRLFKRAQSSIRFRPADMDFVFQWMLDYQTYGGATHGELFGAAQRIRDEDPHSWIASFLSLGDRLYKSACGLEEEGRRRSAASTYLRAYTGYRATLQMMNPRRDDSFYRDDRSA